MHSHAQVWAGFCVLVSNDLLRASPGGTVGVQHPPSLCPNTEAASARTTHLRDGVGEEAVELFVGAISHSTPPRRIEILPDPSQANGHPLSQQGVRVTELFQADGNQVPLQAGFLDRQSEDKWSSAWTQGGALQGDSCLVQPSQYISSL